jgi:hypothetical protein
LSKLFTKMADGGVLDHPRMEKTKKRCNILAIIFKNSNSIDWIVFIKYC